MNNFKTILLNILWLYIMFGCMKYEQKDVKNYLRDVIFLTDNHIIIAKWFGGVAVSKDEGETWSDVETISIVEFAPGENERIWGRFLWRGIHESSEAIITYSNNGGYTWTKINIDSSIMTPVAFISRPQKDPIILSSEGQLWEHSSFSLTEWKKLGEKIPEYSFIAGVKAGNTIYAASENNIWMTRNSGKKWESSSVKDIASFKCEKESCWAITRKGSLYKVERGTNEWRLIIVIPKIEIAFKIDSRGDRIYIASEGKDWQAYGPIVESDLSISELPGIEGKQGYSVKIDPSGDAWFAAQGLYRENKSNWQKVWPSHRCKLKGTV